MGKFAKKKTGPREYYLMAEDEEGQVLEEGWVEGESLKEAKETFFDSLDLYTQNRTACVDDVAERNVKNEHDDS